ncbi:hypothetical protein P152DRAFT_218453 [Eremomyces bilateralis CBS 781.70]|uniref:SGT1-domain-containing protein n=1 Tax=Eremomyces bilateralis CBS 781.70 TaxID=1392243 RepID=A0A6G1FRL3_9PEZI|nr:uncharacterized protein P152DRAFT_218453 [Eremomyces bilateralis CBS 781.70]KAF1808485.1 hypothetical protein P152DRAFT_218453 [Eremomyces bilateralis CBS 781.70]
MGDNGTEPGLKPFGEGFDGFPRQTVNDTVEYTISVLNANLTGSQVRTRLAEVKTAAAELEKRYLREYIWHKDKFELALSRELDRWILGGSTNIGDSVADEWLIVWILRELSLKFDDVWIRVHDPDGEFLAIEAADKVPKWLTPENDANRVWINNGMVRIISISPQLPPELPLSVALKYLSSGPTPPLHSTSTLSNSAFSRIAGHPKTIHTNLHRSIVTVPRKLAFLLLQRPRIVSAAVEAFHLRDPSSMRFLRREPGKNLQLPPTDLVNISVLFSRVGYAQIRTQEFAPPASWFDVHGAVNGESQSEENTLRQRRLDVGMKLTSGFEMLLGNPKSNARKDVLELEILLDDLEAGEAEMPSDDALIENMQRGEDSEGWMDVDWNDFNHALDGGSGDAGAGKVSEVETSKETSRSNTEKAKSSAVEKSTAPDALQNLLSRTRAFMQDEEAGLEGVDDMDEMDIDNDPDDAWSDVSSSGNSSDQVDEEAFNKTLREIASKPAHHHAAAGTGRAALGPDPPPGSNNWGVKTVVPSEWARVKRELLWHEREESRERQREALHVTFTAVDLGGPALFEMTKSKVKTDSKPKSNEQKDPWEQQSAPSDGEDNSYDELAQMEQELRDAGALNIDAPPTARSYGSTGKGKARVADNLDGNEADGQDSEEYRVLANLLESLSAEGGAPGPSRNLMKMLGVDVPQDEDEDDVD